MKKIAISLLLLIGFLSNIQSQTVDSIKVEQTGELIKIHYKILNSSPDQVFKVTILCSINGGLQSVIKSLSGDFGDNIIGGRSDYMVLWDVLKDVEEVKSVDFSVKAELIRDFSDRNRSNSDRNKSYSKKRVHIFLTAGGPGPKFGAKIGYMESWGITAMYASGKGATDIGFGSETTSIYAASLNLTKRVINAEKFKVHLSAGVIASNFLTEDFNSHSYANYTTFASFEGGLIMSIQNFSLSVGVSQFKKDRGDDVLIIDDTFVGNMGLGWRF